MTMYRLEMKPYVETDAQYEKRKIKLSITLEEIKRAVADIKADDEWVNDSHTKAEHRGVCNGLDMLVRHFEELQENDK